MGGPFHDMLLFARHQIAGDAVSIGIFVNFKSQQTERPQIDTSPGLLEGLNGVMGLAAVGRSDMENKMPVHLPGRGIKIRVAVGHLTEDILPEPAFPLRPLIDPGKSLSVTGILPQQFLDPFRRKDILEFIQNIKVQFQLVDGDPQTFPDELPVSAALAGIDCQFRIGIRRFTDQILIDAPAPVQDPAHRLIVHGEGFREFLYILFGEGLLPGLPAEMGIFDPVHGQISGTEVILDRFHDPVQIVISPGFQVTAQPPGSRQLPQLLLQLTLFPGLGIFGQGLLQALRFRGKGLLGLLPVGRVCNVNIFFIRFDGLVQHIVIGLLFFEAPDRLGPRFRVGRHKLFRHRALEPFADLFLPVSDIVFK